MPWLTWCVGRGARRLEACPAAAPAAALARGGALSGLAPRSCCAAAPTATATLAALAAAALPAACAAHPPSTPAPVRQVRTTLGPRGMDKLMHTERAVTVSNDGATIMKVRRPCRCSQAAVHVHHAANEQGSGGLAALSSPQTTARRACRAVELAPAPTRPPDLTCPPPPDCRPTQTLDIVHPAAKTLVDISLAQDAEVCVWGGGAALASAAPAGCCPPALAAQRQFLPLLLRPPAHAGLACTQGSPARRRACASQPTLRLPCPAPRRAPPPRSQVGDGTTTVVLLAAEFLKECKAFVEEGVHPQVSGDALVCVYMLCGWWAWL